MQGPLVHSRVVVLNLTSLNVKFALIRQFDNTIFYDDVLDVKVTSSRGVHTVLVGGETTVNWTVVRTIKCLENVRNCIGTDYRGGMIDTKSCECSSPHGECDIS